MSREPASWGLSEENTRLRERVAVLEQNLRYLQESINTLAKGQQDNRAYTEKRFNEALELQSEMRKEIADLKVVFAARTSASPEQTSTRNYIIAVGAGIALLIVMVLLLWVRVGMPT